MSVSDGLPGKRRGEAYSLSPSKEAYSLLPSREAYSLPHPGEAGSAPPIYTRDWPGFIGGASCHFFFIFRNTCRCNPDFVGMKLELHRHEISIPCRSLFHSFLCCFQPVVCQVDTPESSGSCPCAVLIVLFFFFASPFIPPSIPLCARRGKIPKAPASCLPGPSRGKAHYFRANEAPFKPG